MRLRALMGVSADMQAATAGTGGKLHQETSVAGVTSVADVAAAADGLVENAVGDAAARSGEQSRAPQTGTEAEATAAVPPISGLVSLTRPPPSDHLPPAFAPEFEAEPALIGEGAYAAVRKVRHRTTGDPAALKVVEKHPLLIRNMLPQLQREVRIQGALSHPRLLRLLACTEDEHYVYMLLEFCAGGSLRALSAHMPALRFPEAVASKYFAQTLQGVEFMHQCNVVHRDLKPDNLLLTATDEVRICDFGWSAEVQAERALMTTCGTPNYWAPEIFEGQPQNTPVDLWALGNLIYELLVGHAPFWGSMDELRMKVLSVDIRYPPGLLSNEAISLFYCLMQRDPWTRIPAGRLLSEHPWIRAGLAASPPVGNFLETPPQPAQPPPVWAVPVDASEAADAERRTATVVAWEWLPIGTVAGDGVCGGGSSASTAQASYLGAPAEATFAAPFLEGVAVPATSAATRADAVSVQACPWHEPSPDVAAAMAVAAEAFAVSANAGSGNPARPPVAEVSLLDGVAPAAVSLACAPVVGERKLSSADADATASETT